MKGRLLLNISYTCRQAVDNNRHLHRGDNSDGNLQDTRQQTGTESVIMLFSIKI